MQPKNQYFIVILLLSQILYGCTAIGFMMGKAADESTPDKIIVSQEGIPELNPNREITVIRWRGDTLNGTYLGLQQDSLDLYQQKLLAFRSIMPLSDVLPGPMDSVIVSFVHGQPLRTVVQGYDCRTVVLQGQGDRRMNVLYDEITEIQLGSGRTAGSDLHKLVRSNAVPLLTSVLMRKKGTDDSTSTIPMSEIDHVEYRVAKSGKWIGAICGLAADILALSQLRFRLMSGSM